MIVDTSALLAILFNEPERGEFAVQILEAPVKQISTAIVLEAYIRADGVSERQGELLDELFLALRLQMEPVTLEHVRLAREAYRRYGKGRHPAGLNFGDCFAYALARATGLRLLYKGDDFARTDLK